MEYETFRLDNGYAFDPSKLPPELQPYTDIHMKIDGVVCVKTPDGYIPVPPEAMLPYDGAEDETVLTKAMQR